MRPQTANQTQCDGRLSAPTIAADGNGYLARVLCHVGPQETMRSMWWLQRGPIAGRGSRGWIARRGLEDTRKFTGG